MLCIERPKNHPVRPYRDGRTRPIERSVIAMLRSAAKHVTQPWRTIGRRGLSSKGVHKPTAFRVRRRTSADRQLYSRFPEYISNR